MPTSASETLSLTLINCSNCQNFSSSSSGNDADHSKPRAIEFSNAEIKSTERKFFKTRKLHFSRRETQSILQKSYFFKVPNNFNFLHLRPHLSTQVAHISTSSVKSVPFNFGFPKSVKPRRILCFCIPYQAGRQSTIQPRAHVP